MISGVRRCGKSSLMKTIMEELIEQGISEENIILLDLDSRGYKSVKQPEQLESIIDKYHHIQGLKYLFIDEIQNVSGFKEVITKLTGRYIEFEMLPLSFEEYVGMKRYFESIHSDSTSQLMQITG